LVVAYGEIGSAGPSSRFGSSVAAPYTDEEDAQMTRRTPLSCAANRTLSVPTVFVALLASGSSTDREHVQQPAAGLLEQRACEAVDVHGASLARREPVEGRIQRLVAESRDQRARCYRVARMPLVTADRSTA
jgi:hypothetical protein